MCCPLDAVNGKLIIEAIAFENGKDAILVRGIYDQTPESLSDRISRFFQRIELIEKIAEIADETFHLFGAILQRYSSVIVYQTLRNLHHAAHDVEHTLHTFCFLGDLARLISGKFFEYHDKERTEFDYLRSAARVCHALGHFFATVTFLIELNLNYLRRFETVCKYASAFNAAGYLIWTISILWERHQGNANNHLISDLGIHLSGCFFEAIPLAKTLETFAPYTHIINKVSAIAGIIHALSVVLRLMPEDKVEVTGKFKLPDNILINPPQAPHVHVGNDHDHHHPHFVKVN